MKPEYIFELASGFIPDRDKHRFISWIEDVEIVVKELNSIDYLLYSINTTDHGLNIAVIKKGEQESGKYITIFNTSLLTVIERLKAYLK